MNRIQLALVAAYVAAGSVGAAYLAAIAFFVLNKSVPRNIAFDTWLRYWGAYSADPVQGPRLLLAAAIAAFIVGAAPVLAFVATGRSGRSLHGDARWASTAEIRRAGLL